jgi:hypothetical protein
MASTWSALKIELLETGQNSGTWGTLTNVNLGDAVLGEAITGSATVDFPTDADVTITLTDSATSQSARNLRLNITESSTGVGSVRSLILGSGCQIEKFYLINNTGTGAKTVKNTTGTGISVPAGKATLVYNNGTNVVDAASYFTSLTLGSALPVASGGTGLTAGTSGGVLAFTATGTLASSAALAASALVIGGGAGAAPSTTTTGTGVVTALGVNVGSAGAFVVNGGALGSPSSVGTMPAFTLGGTVSGGGNQINNVVIGTSTPLAGSFTTLGASSTATLNTLVSSGATLTGGTINGMTVGATTASTGAFTTVTATGLITSTSNTGSFVAKRSTVNDYSGVYYETASVKKWLVGMRENLASNNLIVFDETSVVDRLTISTAGLAVTGTLSATGTLSGGTSGTAYSFSGSAPATSLTLNSSGNLGVGTASPAYKLDVVRSGNGLTASIGNGTTATYFYNDGSSTYIAGDSAVNNSMYIFPSGNLIGWTTTNGTTKMVLDGSGNLGIGTSSPGGKLTVKTGTNENLSVLTGGSGDMRISALNDAASATVQLSIQGSPLYFRGSGGAINATLDSSGNLLVGTTSAGGLASGGRGLIEVNGTSDSAFGMKANGTTYGYLYNSASEFRVANITANPVTFFTNNTERMRLDSSGNLFVGATALSSDANFFGYSPGNTFGDFGHSSGVASTTPYIRFIYAGSVIGSITQSGTTAVLYNTTSDQRLKENIQNAESASSLIDSLQVRQFDWKADGSHQRYGFVAQELVTVAPEAVHQPADTDEMMAVDYSKLVPMLVKEIQSLRARVAQLESKV